MEGYYLRDLKTNIDEYINDESDTGCIISSIDTVKKINKLTSLLEDKTTDAMSKFKIADFLCSRLYNVYSIGYTRQEIVTNQIGKTVYESSMMPARLRLCYLKFRDLAISYKISCKLRELGIVDNIIIDNYLQILGCILNYKENASPEVNDSVVNELREFSDRQDLDLGLKMNIADMMLLAGHTREGNELLDVIREEEALMGVYDDIDPINATSTIYADSQNVHSSGINKSVMKTCVNLINIYPPNNAPSSDGLAKRLSDTGVISEKEADKVFERIEIDVSKFKHDSMMFNLLDIFLAVWSFIKGHEHEVELILRLAEEFKEMSGFCSSGHVARLISVIQGFTDDPLLHVKVDEYHYIKGILIHNIDKRMMNAPVSVMNAMIGDDREPFYDYIIKTVNNLIPSILEEYEDSHEHIINIVKQYSAWDHWDIKNEKLVIKKDPLDSKNKIVEWCLSILESIVEWAWFLRPVSMRD
jgi:hypothetical protein